MRIHRSSLVLLMTAAASVSAAQMGQQQQTLGPNQSVMASILAPVTGAPYRAEKVTTSRQVLTDGTVITHETKGVLARDEAGRVREDLYTVRLGQVDGREIDRNLQSTTVGDPVEHRMLTWTGATGKVAVEIKLPSLSIQQGALASMLNVPPPPPPPRPTGVADASSIHSGSGAVTIAGAVPPHGAGSRDAVHTEELGQQSLAGVITTGKRITTTIPLGKIGNDRPIVVVHEEWRSPELGILVKTVDTDPRTGEQTMELRALERVEPSEALFQAPAGYTVQDMAALMKTLGDAGKTSTK